MNWYVNTNFPIYAGIRKNVQSNVNKLHTDTHNRPPTLRA